ncbi:hypothetical protein [Agrococcus sp. Marseille-P2731]|uniref:hypothetical protein n=1 Tax=Agrococcus sp. Marseille-P2731 TaxID=1841862 RepID=UPI00092FF2B9|nr:hypothetical protein [Agrococcus sp. Marseille-P2731]
MTDANEERPLTRRELRARERAAELAATGGMPAVPTDVPASDAQSTDEQSAAEPGDDRSARAGRHSSPSAPSAPADVDLLEAELAEGDDALQPEALPVETDQADVEVPEHPQSESELATPEQSAAAAAPAVATPASKPLGRFFGRKKGKPSQAEQQARADEASHVEADASASTSQEPAETVAIQQVEVEKVDATSPEAADAIEAELAEPAPEPIAPSTPGPVDASVPAPSSARRSSAQFDDVQGLDTVDDAAVDDVEIDEVVVEQPRVSSRRVAEVTPAELEDRRKAQETPDELIVTGPSRGQSQRLPVIVNVVSDTSEHHIADLREQGVAGSGGTSTSSITANALVLPAGSESPEFALEGDDGLLVTGSIDVPEGFASSGRGRAAIDGNDVDADVAEGEVTSPETAPVRASKAVSSYANARVQIAPQKQRANVLPIAVGVGAGGVALAIAGFVAFAFSQGWF